jgi:hypothetical protein
MILLIRHKWNRIAVYIGRTFFILGTVLMLINLLAENGVLHTISLVVLMTYFPVSLFMLFALLITTIRNFKDVHEHVLTLVVIIMNFPIAFLYYHFLNP